MRHLDGEQVKGDADQHRDRDGGEDRRRDAEAERGEAWMNCQCCAYRTPILGREDWQGIPQTTDH